MGRPGPPSATHTLETYVSRLRRIFATSGADATAALVTMPTGYMLDVDPEHIDVCRFRDLAARGDVALDQGDATATVSLVTMALGLWRGPALVDLQDAAFAPLAAKGLEDERLTALEKLTEARLRLGHHRELVPELETVIAGSPYRECFHAQLMIALYRSGRQAEALTAFRRARDLLSGELGIEPGRELRDLERAILVQAPELDPGGGGAVRRALRPVAARPPPGRAARLRRRRWGLGAAAAILGLAAAVGSCGSEMLASPARAGGAPRSHSSPRPANSSSRITIVRAPSPRRMR